MPEIDKVGEISWNKPSTTMPVGISLAKLSLECWDNPMGLAARAGNWPCMFVLTVAIA